MTPKFRSLTPKFDPDPEVYAVMNFIPCNDVDGLAFRRPSAERIAAMAHTLKRQGILAKIRDSAGQEIEGACGQLRARAVKA